jgi:hypothetical protein
MVNFRVRDLNAMAAQLQAAGIAVQVDSTADLLASMILKAIR